MFITLLCVVSFVAGCQIIFVPIFTRHSLEVFFWGKFFRKETGYGGSALYSLFLFLILYNDLIKRVTYEQYTETHNQAGSHGRQ